MKCNLLLIENQNGIPIRKQPKAEKTSLGYIRIFFINSNDPKLLNYREIFLTGNGITRNDFEELPLGKYSIMYVR
jgi:hypothetical protein